MGVFTTSAVMRDGGCRVSVAAKKGKPSWKRGLERYCYE